MEDELSSLSTQLRAAVASRYRPVPFDRAAGVGGEHGPGPAPSLPPAAYEETKQYQEHYEGLRRNALQTLLHVLQGECCLRRERTLCPGDWTAGSRVCSVAGSVPYEALSMVVLEAAARTSKFISLMGGTIHPLPRLLSQPLPPCPLTTLPAVPRTDKAMAEAAQYIFLLERSLLGGDSPPATEPAGASLPSQLAVVLATAALDGSAPPPAAPLFARLLDRALAGGRASFSLDQKAVLVSHAAGRAPTSSGPGWGQPGAGTDALLRSLLDPGPSLAAGRLRDFGVMLDAVLSLPASTPERAILLREFDLGQYALATLQADEGGGHAPQVCQRRGGR